MCSVCEKVQLKIFLVIVYDTYSNSSNVFTHLLTLKFTINRCTSIKRHQSTDLHSIENSHCRLFYYYTWFGDHYSTIAFIINSISVESESCLQNIVTTNNY